jgi:hypothetical protein
MIMRICTCVVFALLATNLVDARQAGQEAERHRVEEKQMFATNRCLPKGGLGIVNTSLYIGLNSARNELLFGEKETWSGMSASKPEVVVFFGNRVWASGSVPKGFDLSKAVVVSFEVDKVRFFDFQVMAGGYYERIRN